MLLTEEEAKKRFCPHLAVAVETRMFRGAETSQSEPIRDRNCLASGCMAWRWPGEVPGYRSVKGWCGLAGKPE